MTARAIFNRLIAPDLQAPGNVGYTPEYYLCLIYPALSCFGY